MSRSLLAEIEAGLSTLPLIDLLNKCILLGGRAGSEKMRDWARAELDGYSALDSIPDYRQLRAQTNIVFSNPAGYNHRVDPFSAADLPPQIREMIAATGRPLDLVPLGAPVGQIEAMAAEGKAEHRLRPYWSDTLLSVINEHYVNPETTRARQFYWSVAKSQLNGVLAQIRTKLTESVAELIAVTPKDQQPTKEAADAAVVYVVTGDRHQFHTILQNAPGATAVTAPNSSSPVTVATGASTANSTTNTGNTTVHGDVTGQLATHSNRVTQRQHNSNTGHQEMAELLRKILAELPDQHGLDDADRDDIDGAAQDALDEVTEDSPEPGKIKRRLSYLAQTLGRIATPIGTGLAEGTHHAASEWASGVLQQVLDTGVIGQ